ncbi:MAG: 50S ribosomal protein L6 [Betaproteobacteria bacterium AqS2]|uniref:Large ribosomal subunit protein uL6 n=1 Tax=Candidatus Amphirhobacter heronislandensis TaxID=1732024 RepID=A0A930UCV2_9GAMM|nr:50S ribosomal protein L6 [Betaproteobacteria bacterium AqS2]
MSRLAKTPIPLPAGTTATVAGGAITVKGKLGELRMAVNENIEVTADDKQILVKKVRDTRFARSLEGTFARRLGGMVAGVTEGCERTLELVGTGYRASVEGGAVKLELGFSHPVSYECPAGVAAETPAQNRIVLRGIDKAKVGQAAADLRRFRPPEPYKGKGVRYEGEHINMKETKKK